jgi:hypothetical protein
MFNVPGGGLSLFTLMKKLRWQILVVVLTLIVVAVLLLSQQPSLLPIVPEPVSGGIYTEALVGSLGRLNPLLDLKNPADRDIDRRAEFRNQTWLNPGAFQKMERSTILPCGPMQTGMMERQSPAMMCFLRSTYYEANFLHILRTYILCGIT